MITVTWYNLTAIIVVMVMFIVYGFSVRNPKGIADYLINEIKTIIFLFVLILFIVLWGGIFWW